MALDFVFEPPSDEEIEYERDDGSDDLGDENEEAENDAVDDSSEEGGVEENSNSRAEKNKKSKQSPWDFSSYSESVADEHARRSTTSIDFKISKALQQRAAAAVPPIDTDSSDHEQNPDSQPDCQVSSFAIPPQVHFHFSFLFGF